MLDMSGCSAHTTLHLQVQLYPHERAARRSCDDWTRLGPRPVLGQATGGVERRTRSRPSSAMGHPCAWIGVGSVNPAFVTSSSTYAAHTKNVIAAKLSIVPKTDVQCGYIAILTPHMLDSIGQHW